MTTANTIPPKVAPGNQACNSPIMAHITTAERKELERIAQLEMRSLSATARMLILRGIEQYDADTLAAE